MLLRTHLVLAYALFLFIYEYFSQPVFLIFLLLATIFVDIDTKHSKLGKRWYLRPIQWLTKHRGIFHTLFFALLLSAIIYYFSRDAGIGFFIGYTLHLIADAFTNRGIKFFWPVSDLKISLGLKSGGLIEEVLFVLVLLFDTFISAKLLFL